MESRTREEFLTILRSKFGDLHRVGPSKSLFILQEKARVYVRYSKVHHRRSTFFGLRKDDLDQLEGFPSFIAFLWDGQKEPLLIPFEKFVDVFRSVEPARDGQYKAHIYSTKEGTDLHVVRAGRFGVDSHYGWEELRNSMDAATVNARPPELSHSQLQTLVGAIGRLTGHRVYIPVADRQSLDWEIVQRFEIVSQPPSIGRHPSPSSLSQIDVVWIKPEKNLLSAVFEIEHSTPIYSGLLRFNDIQIDCKLPRAGIVAEAERKEAYLRQINRRTFIVSGLNDICLFYSYNDVYSWYRRLYSETRV
jgi:hypothetical protein